MNEMVRLKKLPTKLLRGVSGEFYHSSTQCHIIIIIIIISGGSSSSSSSSSSKGKVHPCAGTETLYRSYDP